MKTRKSLATEPARITKRPNICDQLVRQQVALTVHPPRFDKPAHESFTMELELFPDFGTASISIRDYSRRDSQTEDFDIATNQLEAFSNAVAELVAIAKANGFLKAHLSPEKPDAAKS